MGRLHLTSIAPEANIALRLQDIANEFEYNFSKFLSVESYADELGDNQVVMAVLSAISIASDQEIAGHVQVIKQFSPECFIVVVVQKKISPQSVTFIKKSGANLVLSEDTFLETSQIEYLCSQVIRGSLVPIKSTELRPNTDIDFHVMVMMPLNQKILPAAIRGSTLSEGKLKKLQAAKELYVQRDDLSKFQTYTEKHKDLSAHGLQARCRIQYLNLCRAHANLLFLLIDQGETASFVKGKQLLEESEKLANDLLTNLASVEDPWSVVNNSSMGESGSAERSTSIASMAGLLALQLDNISANNVVVAGLLCDFGMLDLHPKILKKIRQNGPSSLNSEDLDAYRRHPLLSVNKCLSRKLPLTDVIKNIIMTTHEQSNGKGFPNQLYQDKIPIEAQVIQFSEIVDQASIVKMGEGRKAIQVIQKEIFAREFNQAEKFSLDFMGKLKKAIET